MIRKFHTTQIIRTEEDGGHDYDQQTLSNFDYAAKKLSDRRQWRDIVAAEGWGGLHQAVKSNQLPRPKVMPIKREMSC